MTCDLLIQNIKGLVQVRENSVLKLSGVAMSSLPVLTDAWIAIQGETILDYGSMNTVPYTGRETVDAAGCFVFPSFVDSHTHLVFASSREEEFVMKIQGSTYEQIAASGGGILNSARKLRETSEDELFQRTFARAREIIATGTGTVEIKSGYGLTVKDELKMLRVARRIGKATPLSVKTTLLGAHAVPSDTKKADYISLVINEMIPAVAEEGLADFIDVFCEQGFFTPDETIRIVEEGKRFGMKPRLHANQLHRSGGVQAGISTGALSVDHLENIGPEEIAALTSSETIPTALPGAAFFLGLPFPPARDMLNAGLALAIASDYNPGSSPSGNMGMMVSLACIKMKLTPAEAYNAATINTAAALELSHSVGSVTRGKLANLYITVPVPSFEYIPYSYGSALVDRVILKGKLLTPDQETP